METTNSLEQTKQQTPHEVAVSETKQDVSSILASIPDPKRIEKDMEKNFDVHERLMDNQLGGFSQKEYDKIHKEKGPKAASEYAASATKKMQEKNSQASKPSEKIETKSEEKPQEKKEDTKPTKVTDKKPQAKPQEKKQDIPKEKKEKKPWNLWGKFKTLAKESKNLISYPFRAGRSTVKYLSVGWYDHGLGKKELKNQWEHFKQDIAWNHKK